MSQINPQSHHQDHEVRRLTLTSNTNYKLPVTAKISIPKFTLPPAPSPNFKPLPKPKPKLKPEKPVKPIKTSQEKKEAKRIEYRKRLEIAKALKAEKERGPLPESEEGEYDAFGFWVEHEKKIVDLAPEYQDEVGGGSGEYLRLRGGGEGREESSSGMEQDKEEAMREVLDDLQAMPSGQPFDDLFDLGKPLYPPPSSQPYQVPAASTAPRSNQNKRKRPAEPMTLHEIPSKSSRARGDQYGSHIMLDQRTQAQYPTSAIRVNVEDDDDDQDLNQMPVSAQPRRESIYQGYYDSQEDEVHLSPTEVNSSAIREPVSRSQTRRSNDRSRVYSLQPGQPSPVERSQDPTQLPPSFAVSDTQPDLDDLTQSPNSPRYVSAPSGPSRIKTYSKAAKNKSAPSRHNTTITTTSRNPAHRPGFKDLFSPEPDWEQEHLTGVSAKDRSKRVGSTSWWPEPDIPDLLHDHGSEEEDGNEGEDEEMGGGLRHILGEVELNERGHRIVTGRGIKRNGPWPDERLKGLFNDDSQDHHRPIELYRPVSDRLHLVQVKEEAQGTLVRDTPSPPDEIKSSRKHNHRANYDHPIVHPPPQLIMRRERSVAERLDE
jgi:hypothetical protein